MTDKQQSELLALDAATCSIEELNRAALLIGGLDQYIKPGEHNRIWSHITPVSDSEWAAGFAMDALMEMDGRLSAYDESGCVSCDVMVHGVEKVFPPLDRTATGRAALCECIHRARLAHWQSEERK
jgi:hypothetical protein